MHSERFHVPVSFCAGCGRITKDAEMHWDYNRQGQPRGYCRECAGRRGLLPAPLEAYSLSRERI